MEVPLCIPHHNLGHYIGTSIWHHLIDHRVFVLGGDQKALNGSATFEVGLNAIPTTDLFNAFTKTLFIGYGNMTLIFDFIGGWLGTCGAPISSLSGRPVESFLHFVQSHLGYLHLVRAFLR